MGRQDRMAEEDETEAMKVPVSAGPCSLLAWPLGNLTSLITGVPNLPANTQFRPPPAKPFGDLLDHLRTCLGSIRSFLVAYVIVFYIHGDDYPAFGVATTLSWSWMWPLLVRNILSAWAVCGFWDWLMYLSPLAARFKPFKIYPKLPTWSQVRHDAFWTTIGMVCATVLEVAYCWGVANGKIQAASSLAESPTAFFIPGGSTGFLDQIRAGSSTSTSTSCTTRATTRPPSLAPASTQSRTPYSCPPASSLCPSESTLSSSSPLWLTVDSLLGLDMGALSSQARETTTTTSTTPTLIATTGPRTSGWTGSLVHLLPGSRM